MQREAFSIRSFLRKQRSENLKLLGFRRKERLGGADGGCKPRMAGASPTRKANMPRYVGLLSHWGTAQWVVPPLGFDPMRAPETRNPPRSAGLHSLAEHKGSASSLWESAYMGLYLLYRMIHRAVRSSRVRPRGGLSNKKARRDRQASNRWWSIGGSNP